MRGLALRSVAAALLAGAALGAMAASASADGGTPVTCGSVIAAPGKYYLAADCVGPGITITASDVQLDLDGHTMDGGGNDPFGIRAQGVSRVHIQGPGTIANYQVNGINFFIDDQMHVDLVATNANGQDGIGIGRSSQIQINNDSATGNGDSGFVVGFGSSDVRFDNVTSNRNRSNGVLSFPGVVQSRVDGSTTNENGHSGIQWFGQSSDFHGNTALGNGFFDLEDDNPGCDSNVWEGNHFVKANQPCIS